MNTTAFIFGALLSALLVIGSYDRCQRLWKRLKRARSKSRSLSGLERREDAARKPSGPPFMLYRSLLVFVLPLALCQCGEEERKAGVGVTIAEFPRHVAQLATEAPPELLWIVIIALVISGFCFDALFYQLGQESGRRRSINSAIHYGFDQIEVLLSEMKLAAEKAPPICPVCEHPIEDIGASVFSVAGQVHLHCYGRLPKPSDQRHAQNVFKPRPVMKDTPIQPAPGAPTHL
jgi:hypothetical protein